MEDNYPPLPELVIQAEALAARNGFSSSCTRRTGALLRTLAGAAGRILELGSGYGVGTAWIVSGMRSASEVVSVERNRDRHRALMSLFTANENATLLQGDWRDALGHGPFDLAFVDVGEAKDAGAGEVIAAMNIGGLLLLDDFSPGRLFQGEHDERWHRWIEHPQLVSCEILTDGGAAAIIACRVT